MSTLKRHHAPGMSPEMYYQILNAARTSQTAAAGFVSHYGVADGDGITVIEVWDSRAQHDAWFNVAVKPQLPAGMPEPEFWEIIDSNTK
jgi:heme-degrading monooxygenase HmoA